MEEKNIEAQFPRGKKGLLTSNSRGENTFNIPLNIILGTSMVSHLLLKSILDVVSKITT